MKSRKPIPDTQRYEFCGFMQEFDNEYASTESWWAILEDSAREYMETKDIQGNHVDAVHQYLRWIAEVSLP